LADKRKKPAALPSKQELLDYVRESPGRIGRREIARAFGVKGADRTVLRSMLKELEAAGEIERRGRRVARPDALPEITIVEVTGTDTDGETLARPVRWSEDGPPPRIFVVPDRGGRHALRAGDRALVRLRRAEEGAYEARIMRRIGYRSSSVLGIFREARRGARIEPTDRRSKSEYAVARSDTGGAEVGELVLAEVVPGRELGLPRAKVTERLGDVHNTRAFSLIAIHAHGIPDRFADQAVAQAENAKPVDLGARVDLRDLPLVTIDGADARDFDDAVWAAPDESRANVGGWHLVVAIADVAHYVRPGDALDRDARERGNSVYFADRVVPMLPPGLSNDLCSLRPDEDRACLAAHLWIDAHGKLRKHRFERALMRSAARLTYDQVQAAVDGRPDDRTADLVEPILRPLYGAYRVLAQARAARAALEIDLPERKIILDDDGRLAGIQVQARHDSHRLIEEFMITANVAAAEALEHAGAPCMYRVHDEPDRTKVAALADFLHDLGLRVTLGNVQQPRLFNGILARAAKTPHADMIAELVLRCQSQAVYSPNNIGHFGLALRRYAHFTSPIRRYADLLVHRSLIAALKLGDGGLTPEEADSFDTLGTHISMTERRAVAAERDTVDRYAAAYMADRQGATMTGRVTGVTRFGLFVRLDETGADGLIPVRLLPRDRYRHDERRHALIGATGGAEYGLGETVEVRVAEANPITGAVILDLLASSRKAGKRGRGRRGRGRRARG